MVSIVIPFCREWPQVVFTLRSVAEMLRDIPFEIIAIDNLQSNQEEDRGSKNVKGLSSNLPWLRYVKKNEKLSSWQCRRYGAEVAKYDVVMYIDAHCIAPIDLAEAIKYYAENYEEMNGTMHLPLTYHILESKRLIYRAVIDIPRADYAYTFYSYRPIAYESELPVFEVPAMSCCGMMIHKKYYNAIGGIPTEMGIYGGGEHFLNYTLAVLGYKKWVYKSKSALYHHGDKRGYSWNHHDYQRNRAIATYMYGGEKILREWLDKCAKLRPREKDFIFIDILKKCVDQREKIRNNQVMSVEEFAHSWRSSSLSKGDWGK